MLRFIRELLTDNKKIFYLCRSILKQHCHVIAIKNKEFPLIF
ncbi:hypothetical protein FHX64_001995 [Microbacter margulisiae]|uniref:Uncharacterized protein n=1 Tax=Microbacter margulisiae TaxID=1350067 RepID=A0A7W5DRL8_9PORP|nr:hypothetical protein [Microbacter margulisiae]